MVASADGEALDKAPNRDTEFERMERDGQGWAALFERPSFDFQVGVDEALALSNSEKTGKQLLSGRVTGRDWFTRCCSRFKTPRELADPRRIRKCPVARAPDAHELQLLGAYLKQRSERPGEGVRDVVWALLTSTEFRFNHCSFRTAGVPPASF